MPRFDPSLTRSAALAAAALLACALAAPAGAGEPRVFTIAPGEGATAYSTTEVARRAFLGVQLEEEVEYPEGGARITRVVDDSPAEAAGLLEGDIIVRFDDQTIRGPAGLTRQIHTKQPGDSVSITLIRDGNEQRLTAEMGTRATLWGALAPAPAPEALVRPEIVDALADTGFFLTCEDDDCLSVPERQEFQKHIGRSMEQLNERLGDLYSCEGDDCGTFWRFMEGSRKPKLGVQLVETTPELRQHLGGDVDAGVLVSKVLSGTPAEYGGIAVGDLIVAVDGRPVVTSGDLRRALEETAASGKETFDVEVSRDGERVILPVTIPEPERDRPTGPRARRASGTVHLSS